MGLGCRPFAVGYPLVVGRKCCSRDFGGPFIDNRQQILLELPMCFAVSCAKRDLQELTLYNLNRGVISLLVWHELLLFHCAVKVYVAVLRANYSRFLLEHQHCAPAVLDTDLEQLLP